MKLIKSNIYDVKTNWQAVFQHFLATGEECMELAEYLSRYKNANSAYIGAYKALERFRYDKIINVVRRGDRIFLVRADRFPKEGGENG